MEKTHEEDIKREAREKRKEKKVADTISNDPKKTLDEMMAEASAAGDAKKDAEAKKEAKKKAEERLKEKQTAEADEEGNTITFSADSVEELLQKITDYSFDNRSNEVQTEYEKQLGQNIDFRG